MVSLSFWEEDQNGKTNVHQKVSKDWKTLDPFVRLVKRFGVHSFLETVCHQTETGRCFSELIPKKFYWNRIKISGTIFLGVWSQGYTSEGTRVVKLLLAPGYSVKWKIHSERWMKLSNNFALYDIFWRILCKMCVSPTPRFIYGKSISSKAAFSQNNYIVSSFQYCFLNVCRRV